MSRALNVVKQCLQILTGLILIALVAVTFIDVVGRYFIAQPLPGGHVIVQCLVCLLIFTGLPIVVFDDAHLRVRLLDRRMTPRLRRWRDIGVNCIVIASLVAVTGQMFWQAGYFGANGEYFESIRIPLSWMAWCAAIATALATVLAILRLFTAGEEQESPS